MATQRKRNVQERRTYRRPTGRMSVLLRSARMKRPTENPPKAPARNWAPFHQTTLSTPHMIPPTSDASRNRPRTCVEEASQSARRTPTIFCRTTHRLGRWVHRVDHSELEDEQRDNERTAVGSNQEDGRPGIPSAPDSFLASTVRNAPAIPGSPESKSKSRDDQESSQHSERCVDPCVEAWWRCCCHSARQSFYRGDDRGEVGDGGGVGGGGTRVGEDDGTSDRGGGRVLELPKRGREEEEEKDGEQDAAS